MTTARVLDIGGLSIEEARRKVEDYRESLDRLLDDALASLAERYRDAEVSRDTREAAEREADALQAELAAFGDEGAA